MNRFRSNSKIDSIIRNRNKGLSDLLETYEARARAKPRRRRIRGVRNGNFFDVRLPPRPNLPELPRLQNLPTPKPLQTLPPEMEHASSSVATGRLTGHGQQYAGRQERILKYFDRIRDFLYLNGPVLIMNIGSFCTLLAFTRTDVLQLRVPSVSGSVCFIVYNILSPPVKWLTIGWTSLFASVNAWKIFEIVNERHSNYDMSPDVEEIYMNHFYPSGITSKQFEIIEKEAIRISIKQGEPLVKQGQRLEHVYLVVDGSTRASILGRYLTAASTTGTTTAPPMEEKEGTNPAAAGAWVGEMAFLEKLWEKEQGKQDGRSGTAMYTVVAKEDCVVWRWSHAKMEGLLARSFDMKNALTRAMTSAVVGKVINYTYSRKSARPSWQTYLDNWKLARGQANTAGFASPREATADEAANVGKESPA